jgi:hypothetical protein
MYKYVIKNNDILARPLLLLTANDDCNKKQGNAVKNRDKKEKI